MNYFCDKCNKSMDEKQFYTYKDGRKTEMCKQCLTMHIDNFNPDTFLWLLEKMDVPYVPGEWNVLRDRAFAKDPIKMNGTSVFGKYLSKMKLKQWKEYGWEHTELLQAKQEEKNKINEEEKKKHEAIIKEKFDHGEISESEYKTLTSTTTQNQQYINGTIMNPVAGTVNNPFQEANFMKEEDLVDLGGTLTEEDKLYLAMKWGRLYKPSEWVELEKSYTEMMNSFDIQDADTMNTLILICKTNLKMNQSLDMGDLDGFQKISRVSESLRKSAKLTAAQNKEEKSNFVDSVGELVAYCEKHGGAIPNYDINTNPDIIDKVIEDLKVYTKSLITEDKALARQIEDYLKKREIADEQKEDRARAKEQGLEQYELSDDDYEEYFETIKKEQSFDDEDEDGE